MKKFLLLIGLISQYSIASNVTPTLQRPNSTCDIEELDLPGMVPAEHRRLGEQSSTEEIDQKKLNELLMETMNSTPRFSEEERARYKAQAEKLSPELRLFFWHLINTYMPTAERCRPSIRNDHSKEPSLLAMPGLKPKLAAMVAGYINICAFDSFDFRVSEGPAQPMQRLFAEMYLSLLEYVPATHTSARYILFAPTAYASAMLLAKSRIKNCCNPYMAGRLLGYEEHDIEAYYRAKKETFAKSNRWCCFSRSNANNWLDVFENHKKYSLDWIERHRPTIDTWIEENRKQIVIRNYREQNTERQSNSSMQ